MAGSVFKAVAERTMILKSKRLPEKLAADSMLQVPHWPAASGGNNIALRKVAAHLNLPYPSPDCDWVKPVSESMDQTANIHEYKIPRGLIPDVTGMGAKDATYLLGNLGMEVRMKGRGKVVAQSRKPGTKLANGGVIELLLQ